MFGNALPGPSRTAVGSSAWVSFCISRRGRAATPRPLAALCRTIGVTVQNRVWSYCLALPPIAGA
jgi:hypothetical protein